MIFYHVVNPLNLAFLECFHADLHQTLREGCKERKNVKVLKKVIKDDTFLHPVRI